MTSGTQHPSFTLERLSAVMDGEADEAALLSSCAAWREAEDGRAAWHDWHLIGDVMRSDDLASDASRDAAFLTAFRTKLADEPVVLAPRIDVAPAQMDGRMVAGARTVRRGRAWTASAAVAAGFVVVAGAVSMMQRTAPSPVVATGSVPTGVLPVAMIRPAQGEAPIVANGQMLRDARFQQYLAAHRQFGAAGALGVPAGYLRGATVDTPGR